MWKIESERHDDRLQRIICIGNGHLSCRLSSRDESDGLWQEAETLVRCLNCHDELVKVCEELLTFAVRHDKESYGCYMSEPWDVMDRAKAILAKVKGE